MTNELSLPTQHHSPHATPGTDTHRPIAALSTTPRLEQTKHHMPAPRVSDTSGRTHARAEKGVPRMRTHSHTRQLQRAAATRNHSTNRARARTVHSVVKASVASGTVEAHARASAHAGVAAACGEVLVADITSESRESSRGTYVSSDDGAYRYEFFAGF